MLPLTPLIVIVYVRSVLYGTLITVNAEEPEARIDVGLKVLLHGVPVALSVTRPVNPLMGVTVT
jgi:hypothetical protein